MLRLRSQFGDMDLSNLMSDEKKTADDHANSEESSLAEPSEEELRAWQEAQFQRGQAALEKKRREETTSAVQRRRDELKKKQKGLASSDDCDSDTADGDWEQISSSPDLRGQSSVFFPTKTRDTEMLGVHPRLTELAASGPEPDLLGTPWKQLYSSAEGDGLSLINLLDNIRGYPGPTVLLLGAVPSSAKTTGKCKPTSCASTTTVGFFSTSPWVESTSFTGNAECFLFAFDGEAEKIKFFKPLNKPDKDSNNYMYCHPATFTATNRRRMNTGGQVARTDGLVHGLGVGGSASQPRLHLTETLEDCRAMDYCNLFEDGDLLLGHAKETLNFFDVDCLEVWAVGGDEWINESLATQKAHRDIQQANLLKARTVQDKRQFVQDFTNGLMSAKHNGLFSHSNQAADRCDL